MEPSKNISVGLGAVSLAVVLLGVFYVYLYRDIFFGGGSATDAVAEQTRQEISNAYDHVRFNPDLKAPLPMTNTVEKFENALATFVSIAGDESKSPLARAQALNGINYAYIESDYDADAIYEAVFSKPPFSAYYEPVNTSSIDPVHPESGKNVESVEKALVKLNELSYALYPNHYAVIRMEVAAMFAFRREQSRATKALPAQTEKYETEVKALIARHDALPPLSSVTGYSLAMRLQMLLAHATAVDFIADLENDAEGAKKAEAFFQEAIRLGEASLASEPDPVNVIRSKVLLVRIFYAASFWGRYRNTDPEYIKDILRPMVTDEANKLTGVYLTYLPEHKDSKVFPIPVLRTIAGQMPELKAFLQGTGWKF